MKTLHAAVAAGATLSLAACATPTTDRPVIGAVSAAEEAQRQVAYVLKARMAEEARVRRVAARLLAANVEVCPAKAWRIGVNVAGLDSMDARIRPAATEVLGMGEQPQVVFVEPGGPADLAGVRDGDRLVRVDGRTIPSGLKATTRTRAILSEFDKREGAYALQLERGGEVRTVEVTPRRVCAYTVRLEDSDVVNAYADGRGLVITRGMLKLTGSDEELAVVIGHELAHDTEGHIAAKQRNAAAGMAGGMALDILAAAAGVNTQGAFTRAAGQAGQAFASPEFEAEADYVGLYYVARAGYDISTAEDFWRKMSVEAPRAIAVTTTHPANASRYLALAATRREIEGKRGAQLALLPARRAPKGVAPSLAAPATANALIPASAAVKP